MAGHECNGIWYFMGPLLLVSFFFMPIINVFLHIILAIKGWTGKIMATENTILQFNGHQKYKFDSIYHYILLRAITLAFNGH